MWHSKGYLCVSYYTRPQRPFLPQRPCYCPTMDRFTLVFLLCMYSVTALATQPCILEIVGVRVLENMQLVCFSLRDPYHNNTLLLDRAVTIPYSVYFSDSGHNGMFDLITSDEYCAAGDDHQDAARHQVICGRPAFEDHLYAPDIVMAGDPKGFYTVRRGNDDMLCYIIPLTRLITTPFTHVNVTHVSSCATAEGCLGSQVCKSTCASLYEGMGANTSCVQDVSNMPSSCVFYVSSTIRKLPMEHLLCLLLRYKGTESISLATKELEITFEKMSRAGRSGRRLGLYNVTLSDKHCYADSTLDTSHTGHDDIVLCGRPPEGIDIFDYHHYYIGDVPRLLDNISGTQPMCRLVVRESAKNNAFRTKYLENNICRSYSPCLATENCKVWCKSLYLGSGYEHLCISRHNDSDNSDSILHKESVAENSTGGMGSSEASDDYRLENTTVQVFGNTTVTVDGHRHTDQTGRVSKEADHFTPSTGIEARMNIKVFSRLTTINVNVSRPDSISLETGTQEQVHNTNDEVSSTAIDHTEKINSMHTGADGPQTGTQRTGTTVTSATAGLWDKVQDTDAPDTLTGHPKDITTDSLEGFGNNITSASNTTYTDDSPQRQITSVLFLSVGLVIATLAIATVIVIFCTFRRTSYHCLRPTYFDLQIREPPLPIRDRQMRVPQTFV